MKDHQSCKKWLKCEYEKMCGQGGQAKKLLMEGIKTCFQKLLIASEMFKKRVLKIKIIANIVKGLQDKGKEIIQEVEQKEN